MLRLCVLGLVAVVWAQTNAPTPAPSSVLIGAESRIKYQEQLAQRNVRCRAHGFNGGEVVVSGPDGAIDLPTTHDANDLLQRSRDQDVAIAEKFRVLYDQATALIPIVSQWSASTVKLAAATNLQKAVDDAAKVNSAAGSFTLSKDLMIDELEKVIAETRHAARNADPASLPKIDKVTLLNILDDQLRMAQDAQRRADAELLAKQQELRFLQAQQQQLRSVEQTILNRFSNFISSGFRSFLGSIVTPDQITTSQAGGVIIKPAGVVGGLTVAKRTDMTLDLLQNVIARCTTGNTGSGAAYPTTDACLGALLPQDAAEFIGPRLHWMDGTDLFSQENSDDVASQACLG